jgi:hypothetical protein
MLLIQPLTASQMPAESAGAEASQCQDTRLNVGRHQL